MTPSIVGRALAARSHSEATLHERTAGKPPTYLLCMLIIVGAGCEELVRNNPCDAAGTSFDVSLCHAAQGVEPGAEGALCRTSADCAQHYACDDGACVFFNNAPVAVADEASTTEDVGFFAVRVTDNDSDVDGDVLVISSVSQGRNGIVTIDENGVDILYRTLPNTNGVDAFTYSVDDGNGGTRTASVTIDVVPENDPPQLRTTSVAVNEDATITVQLELTDPDGDVVTVNQALAASPQHGVAVIANNALSYTPFPDFFGTDTVVVDVEDGTTAVGTPIAIDVFAVNDPPLAKLTGPGDVVRDDDGDGVLPLLFDASASTDVDDASALGFTWFVDGVPQAEATDVEAPTLSLGPGAHVVTVAVRDAVGAESQVSLDVNAVATRLFVNADAATFGSDESAFSWTRATSSLDSALALAATLPDVREIWVAAGAYRTTKVNGFALVADVAVLGGFAGNETFVEERDAFVNATILSGDRSGDDTANFGNRIDNSFHVVNAVDVAGAPLLDGFVIRGGFARSDVERDADRGAAILVRNARPSLLRLLIVDNVAIGVQAPDADGTGGEPGTGTVGGIVAAIDSDMVLAFTALVGNAAKVDVGGGIGVVGGQPFLLNVLVAEMVDGGGGAAAAFGGGMGFIGSSPNVFGCALLANRAARGSAIFGALSTVSVRFATIVDNAAGPNGSAVEGAFFTQSSIFVNNTIAGAPDPGPADDIALDSCLSGVVFANPTAGADGVPYTRDDDYTLDPSSCGFDAGAEGVFSTENVDLLFRPRIVGAAPDMGGYEAP